MITLCTQHGREPTCKLARSLRRQYQSAVKRRDPGDRLILTSVIADDPEHAVLCAADGRRGKRFDPEHDAMLQRCLRSAVRSAKLRLTKERKAAENACR